jgi:DNA-3-methyladenine glycosylase II
MNATDNFSMLTTSSLKRGLRVITAGDQDLRRVFQELGTPPMWNREPGFPTLMHIILEQQVSLASARAAYNRLHEAAAPLTPARFLELDAVSLKAVGFSRQKIVYGRNLAEAVISGSLDLAALSVMSDIAVKDELLKVKGIGHWTADIYLLMALCRPDAWPRGDLALAVAAQEVKRLPVRPTPDELEALSRQWQPWRAVAARLLWHHYLNRRARKKSLHMIAQ